MIINKELKILKTLLFNYNYYKFVSDLEKENLIGSRTSDYY